ncbi:MAG: SCO family protein [Pseudomonadota bacterium]
MTTPGKSNISLITWLLILLAVTVGAVIHFGNVKNLSVQSKNVKISGLYLPAALDIANFQLTDNSGKPFSNANLKGHWTMMFFGFTNCGMVCPTTMAALNSMYQTLQQQLPERLVPNVVMVSVDPERDSVERMNAYVTTFNQKFIGARAELPQITALEKELHLVAIKMQAGDNQNQYTINHSAEIMVFNPDGKLQAFMSYPHVAEQMITDYKNILTSQVA